MEKVKVQSQYHRLMRRLSKSKNGLDPIIYKGSLPTRAYKKRNILMMTMLLCDMIINFIFYMKSITAEYLNEAATLMKMTTFFESTSHFIFNHSQAGRTKNQDEYDPPF